MAKDILSPDSQDALATQPLDALAGDVLQGPWGSEPRPTPEDRQRELRRILGTPTWQQPTPPPPLPIGPQGPTPKQGQVIPPQNLKQITIGKKGERIVTYRPQKLVAEGRLSIDEALEIPPFWASKPNDNEYAAVEQLYARIGAEYGLAPAEAQAAAWAGAGKLTGLGTEADRTFPELLNQRIMYTAHIRNEHPQQVLSDMIRGRKPLLGLGGLGITTPIILDELGEPQDN